MANPVEMLKQDHQKVQQLFQQFENAQSKQQKKSIADQALKELQVHAKLEEQIFYKTLRSALPDAEETLNEAEEEHHVADMLMKELMKMNSSDSHFGAKFKVLAESVRHHIKEEEGQMLPSAQN